MLMLFVTFLCSFFFVLFSSNTHFFYCTCCYYVHYFCTIVSPMSFLYAFYMQGRTVAKYITQVVFVGTTRQFIILQKPVCLNCVLDYTKYFMHLVFMCNICSSIISFLCFFNPESGFLYQYRFSIYNAFVFFRFKSYMCCVKMSKARSTFYQLYFIFDSCD